MLLVLVLPTVVQAQFTYTTNDGAITITGYTGPAGAVIIPDMIDGLPVTSIGDWAFSHRATNLTSITIPDSVTSIGHDAFNNLASLTSVNIGSNVTSIGYYAFYCCYGLTNVTIPNSVTNIGICAFSCCFSLTNVTIGNSVTSIGYQFFYACRNLTSVTIGNSVTSIGEAAFAYCTSLTNVTIPDSVTSIGRGVFALCTNLNNVTMGNSVTSIGEAAFNGCGRLTSVTIPNSVTSIGILPFANCPRLTGVYFQGNAPSDDSHGADHAIIYYLPETTGWYTPFGGRPAVLWNPQVQVSDASFGVQMDGFGLPITGTTNIPIVVEACTDLANPAWSAVGTNILTGGWFYFSDPQWTNYPHRFYRLRSP